MNVLKKLHNYFLLVSCLAITSHTQAQANVLIVSSEDSLNFELSINDASIMDSLVSSYTVPLSNYKKTISVEAKFENGKISSSKLNLEKNTLVKYELMSIRDQYIFAEISVSPIISSPIEAVAEVRTMAENNSVESIEDLQISEDMDTLQIKEPVLPEIQGCSYPIGSSLVADKIQKLERLLFQFQRIDLLNVELQRDCFRVKDINKLVSTIEYEDQRLELLILAYESTYDLENYASLSSLLLLKKNQDLFFRFYQRQINLN